MASLALAGIAASRGETLIVPRQLRWRLVGSALLNVSAWMGLTTLSLVWLNAGEAATLAYTMPVWTALLAWPVLGEKLVLSRIVALVLASAGSLCCLAERLRCRRGQTARRQIVLAAAMLFALGTVLGKRSPLNMTPIAMTAWQVGIGCIVLLGASLVLEHPHLLEMHWFGWAALSYTAAVSLGICYITWFAALRRLEAGTAAIGTLLTPIIGVVASANRSASHCCYHNSRLLLWLSLASSSRCGRPKAFVYSRGGCKCFLPLPDMTSQIALGYGSPSDPST